MTPDPHISTPPTARPSRPRRAPGVARLAVAALAAVLLAALATGAGAASVRVSPTRIEFSLEGRTTDFFTVINAADRPVRLRVYARFVTFNENNQLVEGGESPYDMTDWVVLSPRRVSLEPQQRRVVRFTVRPPAELAQGGEYRTVIFFEELPPPPEPSQPAQESPQFELRLLTRIGVSLYGMAGERRVDAALEGAGAVVENGQVVLRTRLRNSGNAYAVLHPTVRLLDEDQDEVYRFEGRVVLQRDQTLNWSHALDAPEPGAYTLHFAARHDEERVLERSLPLQVEAAPN